MIKVKSMTHYITHHCTLNCLNCNTFNNFDFKGSVNWSAERENYKSWSQKCTSDEIGVLGGEPLLHPQLEQILRDIHHWHKPIEGISLATNGTLIEKIFKLKDVFVQTNTTLDISLHSQMWMRKWLKKFKRYFPELKLLVKHNQPMECYDFTDPSGMKGRIFIWTAFREATVIEDKGRFTVHSSDMHKAHDACDVKECHSIYNNKLYKCRQAALIKEFVEQKKDKFDLTEQQKKLIEIDHGIPLEDIDSDTNTKLLEPLSMCSICPERRDSYINLTEFFGNRKIQKVL